LRSAGVSRVPSIEKLHPADRRVRVAVAVEARDGRLREAVAELGAELLRHPVRRERAVVVRAEPGSRVARFRISPGDPLGPRQRLPVARELV
jgi:hypothetical protein